MSKCLFVFRQICNFAVSIVDEATTVNIETCYYA